MNDLPFELFIAVRYLLARRKQAFISLISLISILGVMVGVMALLIALALMTGLQGELRDRIVGSTAHVYVFKAGTGLQDYDAEIAKLKQVPHVLGAAPVVLGQGMVTGASGEAFVTLKGVVPKLEPDVTRIAEAMQKGSLSALDTPEGEMPGIVIGAQLATKLGSFVGDTLHVMTPQGTLTPGGMSFAPRRFKVVGLFSLGLLEFDEAYAYMQMDAARRMLGKDRPDFIELRVDDLFAAQAVAESIPERLGSEYMPQDWADMNQSLFSALSLEKLAISITIGLIVMVAALNIVASLVLLVMEKSRDIAILKTMGSSAASIRRIFMFQGLVIGLVGTLGGAIIGCITIFIADRYKLVRVPVDVYQISYVPFRLELLDFAVVIGSAVLICFIATIYPSRQAARLDPAQALRYQ
ncbi:MAG TPA: lipoprotein-releasing ABC transporter permease subunit [Vicinamibacterales bacterium]|nr:lipoprotein-releasing ABC transporter permease subunit [Vicinamibacterales bacterium]